MKRNYQINKVVTFTARRERKNFSTENENSRSEILLCLIKMHLTAIWFQNKCIWMSSNFFPFSSWAFLLLLLLPVECSESSRTFSMFSRTLGMLIANRSYLVVEPPKVFHWLIVRKSSENERQALLKLPEHDHNSSWLQAASSRLTNFVLGLQVEQSNLGFHVSMLFFSRATA